MGAAPAIRRATVKGFIAGGDQSMMTCKCKGNPAYVPTVEGCYARLFAVNSTDALASLGATIQAG
ncbi:hypothetical protein GCM10010435_69020 [Winogradskya consettensis]|uniref:Uncharacterized protein n=1 Tax=Winogradskya consettensis TaxID=113560 RepID=A0A919VRB9_9ACTN|nr:hypothetical protein Aco04nite_35760 [Actinoplanes consettensis]